MEGVTSVELSVGIVLGNKKSVGHMVYIHLYSFLTGCLHEGLFDINCAFT